MSSLPRPRSVALLIASLTTIGLFASCHPSGVNKATGEPYYAAEVFDFESVSMHDGEFVRLEGTFSHDRGIHVFVTTPRGLVVRLLHFDDFKRGDDWLKYAGKKVVVIGRIRKYTREGDGYDRPTMAIQYFRVVGESSTISR